MQSFKGNTEKNPLKAGHYFMQASSAAALADDPVYSKNTQLPGELAIGNQQLAQVFQHEDAVNGAQFNADESRILTWSEDGTARLWDAASGEPIGAPMRHEEHCQGRRSSMPMRAGF